VRFGGTCYRAHDPRWSFSPLSGDGARLKGGRFNPVGTPALYLATTLTGMFAEMGHGFARRFEPLTVCCYDVEVDDVLDLTDESERARLGLTIEDLGCAWALDVAEGREPASWRIARRLIADGVHGILVPSFANGAPEGASNLVLWRWGPGPPHKVEVYDPSRRLPADQLSWTRADGAPR
jgi:RES domain-containing protein